MAAEPEENEGSAQPDEPGVEGNDQAQVLQGIPIGPAVAVPIGQTLEIQQLQIWQGQFPPPEAIERYEAVMPGAFDRLMRMAERQQEASIEGTAEARAFARRDNQRGHYLGFVVTVFALLGAIACAYFGQPWVAAALVGVPVLAVARALVESSRVENATSPVAIKLPATDSKSASSSSEKS